MARALQISLMILTAALCGVCVLQWQRESQSVAREQALTKDLQTLQETLQQQTGRLETWEQEITRLNAALAEQTEAQKAVADLETRLREATQQIDIKTTAITELTSTGQTLATQLKKAMDERDALAVKLNERTREYNTLAAKSRPKP